MAFFSITDAEVRIGYEVTAGVSPTDGYLINSKTFGITTDRDTAVRALLNADAVVAKSSAGGRTGSPGHRAPGRIGGELRPRGQWLRPNPRGGPQPASYFSCPGFYRSRSDAGPA